MNKLKIVVSGAAGRMGSLISGLVKSSGDMELAGVVDRSENMDRLSGCGCMASDSLAAVLDNVKDCVVIDFTTAEAALASAQTAAAHNAAIVIGTTGLNELQKCSLADLASKTPILWSANMSIGVNVLLWMLPQLAHALGPAYDMEMVEIHHRHKKDAPSGTALMLGESLANARGWNLAETRKSCRDGIAGERQDEEIGIMALRGGDVVGIHTIYFMGAGEVIEVKHQAQSRGNFAEGAVRAARWLAGREPGRLYSMQDVIA